MEHHGFRRTGHLVSPPLVEPLHQTVSFGWYRVANHRVLLTFGLKLACLPRTLVKSNCRRSESFKMAYTRLLTRTRFHWRHGFNCGGWPSRCILRLASLGHCVYRKPLCICSAQQCSLTWNFLSSSVQTAHLWQAYLYDVLFSFSLEETSIGQSDLCSVLQQIYEKLFFTTHMTCCAVWSTLVSLSSWRHQHLVGHFGGSQSV